MTATMTLRRLLVAGAAGVLALSAAQAQLSLTPPAQQKTPPKSEPKHIAPKKDAARESAKTAAPAKSASSKSNAKSAPSPATPPLDYTNAPSEALPPDDPNIDLAMARFQRGDYGNAFKITRPARRAAQRPEGHDLARRTLFQW